MTDALDACDTSLKVNYLTFEEWGITTRPQLLPKFYMIALGIDKGKIR